MPRTCTAGERSIIAATAVTHRLKLQVADADGTLRDCSALGSLSVDFLDGATWGETLETPIGTGTLTIRRDSNGDTASPLVGGSSINRNAMGAYAPLFEKGRAIVVSTATLAPGVTPSSGDWKEMFTGRIGTVHWHDNPMTVDISDIGAWVMDAQLQAPAQFITAAAPGAGPLLGAIVQSMLDAVIPPAGAIPLYQPVTAPFQPYSPTPQQPGSIFTTARSLVQEIGWELRYRYSYDVGAGKDLFKFTLYEPARTNTTPDWTIGPNEYRAVRRLESSIDDIRNYIKGYYNVLAVSKSFVVSQSPTSIAKYGGPKAVPRFMQVSSSKITNATDMQALTDAILSDLSEAPADQEIELSYFWPVQLGDLITFVANGDHYDSDQTLAVVGYQHTFANGEGITTIQARGKVAGAFRLWLRRGSDGLVANGDTIASSILRVASTESTDGTIRNFTVTIGASVDTVHVHYRTVPINASGDVFNFSGNETVAVSPSLLILRRSATSDAITFSLPHPSRGYMVAIRMVPRTASPDFFEGESWPMVLDAAPQAVNAKIHPARVGTTGSLSIDIAFGVSDGPVSVNVIQDTLTTSTSILSTTLGAPVTLDSGTYPALGNIALPTGKDFLAFRVVITDVSGQAYGFGPANLSRAPIPTGTPTLKNYRPTPVFECQFDPDTTSIRYTSKSGRVRTLNAAALAAAGSPISITVSVDAFDDATTESALVVDELRAGVTIDYQGGGQWFPQWKGDLHGQPSNPPMADIRTIANSDRSAMDVTVRPDTQVNEKLFVYFRDGSTDTALQWIACVSAGDPTALQVVAGTLLGPANFFRRVDGVGSPTAKLSAIALGRDQLSKYGVMIKGVDSGIQSPWLDVVLSLAEQPWNESVDLRFDPATRELAVYIVAGAHVASEGVLFADNDAFSAPLTGSGNVTDGNTLKVAVTLSAAQLGKPWYAKVTPFNAASLGGLMGAPQKATVQVPAIIGDPIVTVVEAGGNATITVQIDDPGSYLNTAWTNGTITTALHFAIQKLGVGTIEAQTTHTLVGTLHTWTKVIALDLLHMINVGIFAHFIDGSTAGVWSSGVDSNKISDVVSGPSAANNGVTATVSVGWDSDTLIGSNCARYSLDNGATWTSTVTVTSALLSQFNVTRIATKQTLLVQAKNALDGAWGNQGTVEVDAYIADGPSFDVHLVEGTTTTAVYWSCTSGVATLSIDGGTAGTPPASPITVTRPAAGQKKLNYNFAFAIAGQTITDSVDVNPIDADTVTPNLTVTPGTPTATTQPYTVTFSNPKAGGAAPTATVTCAGCTMTIGGTTYVDGTTQALSTGDVVTANRPSTVTTTQAKLKFDATLAGGGSESIVAEVTLQLGLGPSLTITETLNDVSDLIAYTSTGTLTVSINGAAYGTPAASPITVNRSVLDQTYSFQCTADGQTISRSVIIPAVVAIPQGTLSIDKIAGNTASQAQWSFRVDGAANVASYRYAVSTSAEPDDTTTASTGTIANGRSFSVVNGGTIGLGTTVYVTLIPFTQASGAGSQLKSIHLRDTFTTFGSSKTVSFSSSAWNEMIGTGKVYGVVRTGSFAPQNPALEPIGAGVGTQELGMNATTPVGVKLHQVSFVCAWNSAAQPLGTFVFALYLNGVFQGSVSPAYNSGTQTKTIALSDVAVNTNNAILIYAKFTGPASGANATLAQAALGDVSLNYIMTTNDQTY
jgi:hypothetical protein